MLVHITNLRLTGENPRKTPPTKQEDDELVASMRAYGQLTSILVKRSADGDGIFDIVEGGRRFRLAPEAGLTQLKAEIYDGNRPAEEIGAAANMARAAMHPIDEAAVIAHAIDAGDTAADIAIRFGQTERWALQRHKLNSLSDRAKKLLRNDGLTLAAAEALTLVDTKTQDAYLKKARHDWQLEPREIRRQLTRGDVPAKVALFALEHYPQHAIRRDLFSEDVWLTDRAAFEQLQTQALENNVEALKGEGWADVQLVVNPDYKWHHANVAAEGKITKAARAKFNAFVLYNSHSGRAEEVRGYTTPAELKRAKKAADKAGKSKADAEDVEAQTCYDLSQNQRQMIAALQTEGIAKAIAAGDTWLALQAILTPLLDEDDEKKPSWAGLRPSYPNWIGANVTFDQKIDHPGRAAVKFPTRAAFEKMPWEEVMALVRAAALASLTLLYAPNAEAAKAAKTAGVEWFRYDAGFLRRYRLDALQDLAKHLKVDSDGLKKRELVDAILKHQGAPFLPVKWQD